jgi:PAS domain-containing protein
MSRFATLALDALLATIEDAAAVVTAELEVAHANDAMRALYHELTGRTLVDGSTLDERWGEAERARFLPLYQAALAGERVEVELEVDVPHASGRPRSGCASSPSAARVARWACSPRRET